LNQAVPGQHSVLSEEAENFPVTVISWPMRDLAKRVQDVRADYDHVVIDTGRAPGTDDPILRQALMVSDQLVIPVSPSLMDTRELRKVLALVEELEPLHHVEARVLLTKTRVGTSSARDVREGLAEQGIPLFTCQIGLRESYASAWGTTPTDLGEYRYVMDELTGARV
jgi:ATPases involved in chromosome partitioning